MVQGSRTVVSVLWEHDHYRAELRNLDASAVLVDRVGRSHPRDRALAAMTDLPTF